MFVPDYIKIKQITEEFGRGLISFQEYHNLLLPFYEKRGKLHE